jgi:hypothetical protein
MANTSTALTMFVPAIRAFIGDEDRWEHSHSQINEKIKVVLDFGKVLGYKISVDGSSVEPSLTPETDHKSYAQITAMPLRWTPMAIVTSRVLSKELPIFPG